MALPSVTDLKIHLNSSNDEHDDEMADVLDAAVDVVSNIVGPLEPGPVTETHYATASQTLLLRQMPVGEVTAVSSGSYGFSGVSALALSDYELDPSAGVLRMVSGGYFSGDVTVTYTTGLETLPASIRLATLIIAAHLWETQRGTAPTALALQQQDTFSDPGTFGAGFAIPNRAKELLAPYVRPTVA